MENNILLFAVVGFLAQIIDGTLGMAYGVSSTTFLLSIGVSPAAASASVHTAEIFTTAVSGLSHWRMGNVDRQLLKRLLLPGVIGGAAGAYILTAVPSGIIKPIVSAYLLIMGIVILIRAIRQRTAEANVTTHLIPLGLAGGFFDAIGGGGWGPIVTTTLVARGNNPRSAIGSVNLTEFFVTLSESIIFILTIGLTHWRVIVGLLIGGIVAAPAAAYACKHLPARALMLLVGVLIIILSIRTILLTL
ncbi:MAG: sulfite exporter TauE/SafE family protein [Chloroflexi bacterium]|nr:sulfite exporter TauE/SafE family protein [Chloroflexota bacterium]